MEVILTDPKGYQIRNLQKCNLDADLNGEKDFELVLKAVLFDEQYKVGCRIFVPETEIGGILGGWRSNSKDGTVTLLGDTWRGMMQKKIIVPPEGEDYCKVSGELNDILKKLIEPRFSGLFKVSSKSTEIEIKYQFDRYCTLYDGIVKMLKTVGHKLKLSYKVGNPNGYGWVDVQAEKIKDYSKEIELSQDDRLTFEVTEKYNGINHLIVGGKGELQERTILHLYVQKDGSIGKEQYYKGLDEKEAFYDNTSAESDELEKEGVERLKEIMDTKTFVVDIEELADEVDIGDIIGGRDQMTGIHLSRPIKNVIVTAKDGVANKEYKLEE